MIRVEIGDLATADAAAVLRPVAADWSSVTPTMRRLEAAAGDAVAEQCLRLGELPVGGAAITGGGALAAEFLVHAVVRSRDQPVSAATVRRALLNGLRRLAEWGVESVAMPPFGTGAGNLDPEESASAMLPVLREHLASSSAPSSVILVVESEYERDVFERALRRQSARST